MDGSAVIESKIIAKKGVKEKLSNWYIKNFDKPKNEDNLRKAYATYMDIRGAVGQALVALYVPELTTIAPKILKMTKTRKLKTYDRIKDFADKKLGLESRSEEEFTEEGFANQSELQAIGSLASTFLDTNTHSIDKNPTISGQGMPKPSESKQKYPDVLDELPDEYSKGGMSI